MPGDTNAHSDIFVRDQTTGTTIRVSVSSAGAQGSRRQRHAASISAYGQGGTWRSRRPPRTSCRPTRTREAAHLLSATWPRDRPRGCRWTSSGAEADGDSLEPLHLRERALRHLFLARHQSRSRGHGMGSKSIFRPRSDGPAITTRGCPSRGREPEAERRQLRASISANGKFGDLFHRSPRTPCRRTRGHAALDVFLRHLK